MSTSCQTTNIYKPSEAKIRRVQTPPQYGTIMATTTTGAAGTETVMPSHFTAATLTTSLNHHHHNQQQQLQHRTPDITKPDSHGKFTVNSETL